MQIHNFQLRVFLYMQDERSVKNECMWQRTDPFVRDNNVLWG